MSDNTRTTTIAFACVLGLAWMVSPAGAQKAAASSPDPKAAGPLPPLTNTNVSIPWQELRSLLDAARRTEEDRPPVSYVFSPAEYTAVVSGEAVAVAATCDVEVLADKWALVPLGPAVGALRKVTVDGKACPVAMQGQNVCALLTGKGVKKLRIEIEAAVTAEKGTSRFQVPLVPSPIVTLTTTIPRVGLDVRADRASTVKAAEADGKTQAVSSHRGGATAMISWQARPVRPKAMPTRLYADAETLVSLDDGLARCTADVRLQIVHTPLSKLRLRVDPAAAVLSVSGEGVSGWGLADEKGAKVVEVTFAAACTGLRSVQVVTERDLPEAGGELRFQAVQVEAAKRDRGVIAVRSAGGWEIKPADASAERIGISELPASVRKAAGSGLELAYRYREAPAAASLTVARPKRLPARTYADTATLVSVEAGRLRCRAAVGYDILHAGVDTLRIELPEGVDLLGVTGPTVRHRQVLTEGKKRTLVVDLTDLAQGSYELTVSYEKRLADGDLAPAVPLLSHPGATQDRGSVGIEVRGGLEVKAAAKGAERVDVKELAGSLWASARSPLLMGYQYAKPGANITLSITRHKDVSVLVAMSDVCETATTITPDGKSITKMMFILRNNLKQFMRLKLPEGAEIWSAFVKDSPVTPVRTADGDVLIPLVKSDAVDPDDDEERSQSYRARRDRRRREGPADVLRARSDRMYDRVKKLRDIRADEPPAELKPYDVEIVFVTPKAKLAGRGELKVALPKSDIPTGHMAWAVLLPAGLRVVDAEGNLKEVSRFSLPFRHFADAEYARRFATEQLAKAEAARQMQKLADVQEKLAELAVQAKAQGVLPVRVEIPITGQMSRFEKFLVVDEAPEITLTYRRKID